VDYYNLQADPQTACLPLAVQKFEFTGALEAYQECAIKTFGFDWQGLQCVVDSDCDKGYCDITKRRCMIDLDILEQRFLNCFIDNLDPFSVQFFYDYFNVSSNSKLYTVTCKCWRRICWLTERYQALYDATHETHDCAGDYLLAIELRDHVSFEPDNPGIFAHLVFVVPNWYRT